MLDTWYIMAKNGNCHWYIMDHHGTLHPMGLTELPNLLPQLCLDCSRSAAGDLISSDLHVPRCPN